MRSKVLSSSSFLSKIFILYLVLLDVYICMYVYALDKGRGDDEKDQGISRAMRSLRKLREELTAVGVFLV